jgi:hypothetical protein
VRPKPTGAGLLLHLTLQTKNPGELRRSGRFHALCGGRVSSCLSTGRSSSHNIYQREGFE